jgi:hypothetical protein
MGLFERRCHGPNGRFVAAGYKRSEEDRTSVSVQILMQIRLLSHGRITYFNLGKKDGRSVS